jgi:hypothetical protein
MDDRQHTDKVDTPQEEEFSIEVVKVDTETVLLQPKSY